MALIALLHFAATAQNIGMGTASPDASAALDITHGSKGLLIPRMGSANITAISNPAKGLMVYDSVKNQLMVNMGTAAAPNWQTVVAASGWGLNGNSGTNPSVQFIGNTDNSPLKFRINNTIAGELNPSGNIFWGMRAGQHITTATGNIAIGTDALAANQGATRNVAIGEAALANTNYTGVGITACCNIGVGFNALNFNTTGYNNTAVGTRAMHDNSTGLDNTAFGESALEGNSTGNQNTAVGSGAIVGTNTGNLNSASGFWALHYNQTGLSNTASGAYALWQNQAGSYNVAIGASAQYENKGSLGSFNTAVGAAALLNTTNSQYNTAIGYAAGYGSDLGYNNTFLGANTGANGGGLFNVIAIGQDVTCTASSQVTIGNGATSSYRAYANWSNISDGRFKKNIQENVPGLDFISRLRPVTYNLNATGLDVFLHSSVNTPSNTERKAEPINEAAKAVTSKALREKESVVYTGFVAQEVEASAKQLGFAFSGIDAPANEKDVYGLRYAEFVVPLVKAVQEQQQMIADMQKRIQVLEDQNKLLLQPTKHK